MAGKTLSNGTLSLRFMQNAQRAKLQAQVELEQAKIKDDAEWEVPKEVKDAWGIARSNNNSISTVRFRPSARRISPNPHRTTVVHESSYLPFMFASQDQEEGPSSSTQPAPPAKLRGRRAFNGRGEEVFPEERKAAPDAADAADEKPPKPERRPFAISGFRAPRDAQKDGKKARTKTAQMLVHSISRRSGFVKPAGVDEPGARAGPALKRERGQDLGADLPGSEVKRRKKKKDISS
ncbi:hypothetical protein A0H81_05499 [Grifola frondosa]|uniref:Uncharacterized protein n=1 Tax=Grifola frondosa TaxID=5627 RepID=A0A1C7MEQ8_GRIFR|nr:hypothetical protein A0H81_05499 [Grifola frondosa]